jgi:spore coat polysaccharide biosynthesis protein SpsF
MSIIAIIQSRMTSERYPGKMLAPFLGKPLLAHVVDRIKITKVNPKIILATSENHTDDPLAVYAKYLGIEVVRGSHKDVFSRFVLTLNKFKCDAFFRVCGDSPLLLPFLFDEAVSIYRNNLNDLVTNVFPKTFPAGMSVELVKTKTFLELEKNITNNEDQEHITKYFYNHSKDFKIYNLECAKPVDLNLKLAVDKPEDLQKIKAWYLANDADCEDLFPLLKQ